MAKITKPIYHAVIITVGNKTLYTAPAGGAIVNFIQLCNLGAGVDTLYSLWRVATAQSVGDQYQLVKDQEIGAGTVVNETQQAPFGNWFLDAGDFIVIDITGTTKNLSVALNVVEDPP